MIRDLPPSLTPIRVYCGGASPQHSPMHAGRGCRGILSASRRCSFAAGVAVPFSAALAVYLCLSAATFQNSQRSSRALLLLDAPAAVSAASQQSVALHTAQPQQRRLPDFEVDDHIAPAVAVPRSEGVDSMKAVKRSAVALPAAPEQAAMQSHVIKLTTVQLGASGDTVSADGAALRKSAAPPQIVAAASTAGYVPKELAACMANEAAAAYTIDDFLHRRPARCSLPCLWQFHSCDT